MSEDSYRGNNADPLSLNLYTYCINSPIRFADPTGHWPDWSAIGNGIVDAAKSFGNGFTDFFKGQWDSLNGVLNDPIGSYVDFMTETWSHPIKNNPIINVVKSEYETVTGMWRDVFNQDYNSLAYEFGNRPAMCVEVIAFNAAGQAISKMKMSFGGIASDISNDILGKPRTGSALKVDAVKPVYEIDSVTGKLRMVKEFPATAQSHGFNNIIDNYAGQAVKTSLNNASLYQLEGSLNGVSGRFEWIIQNGNVTHRMFISGGTVNGVPIKP